MADLLADVARLGRWPVRLVAKRLILPMSLPPGQLIGFGVYVCLVDRGVRQAEAELADEIGLIEVRAGPPSSGHSAPSSAASRSRRR
jgi:hypothetical protein